MDASINISLFSNTNVYTLNDTVDSTKQEDKNVNILPKFKARNAHDLNLEKKVMFIQRHFRAKIRIDSEIQRITSLGLKRDGKAITDGKAIIDIANKPYRPKKCSPELADRIMKAASQIKLYAYYSSCRY